MSEPITNVEDAVAKLGALPVPVGPQQQALSVERLTEIVESHPGGWYSGEWRSEDYSAGEFSEYIVKHVESDTVLAELPDWAGPLALFFADAHDAVPELVAEVRRLRSRVAELEAERHSTNEALDDAAKALRADRDRIAELEAQRTADHVTWQHDLRTARAEREATAARIAELEALTPAAIQSCRKCGAGYTYGEPCSTCMFRERMAAETQALSARDEFGLHHDYRVPRDLPESGGA